VTSAITGETWPSSFSTLVGSSRTCCRQHGGGRPRGTACSLPRINRNLCDCLKTLRWFTFPSIKPQHARKRKGVERLFGSEKTPEPVVMSAGPRLRDQPPSG